MAGSPEGGLGVVLLAAGESQRMTALPETAGSSRAAPPKALLPWLGRPLLRYQLEQISAVAGRVVVVTGFHAARLAPLLEPFAGVRVVENPDPARGRSSSIVHGVRALPESLAAVAIVNVDQPCAAAILTQLAAARDAAGHLLTLPRYQGKRGHPPLFAHSLRGELLRVREESQGLKAVTRAHRAATGYVDVDDPGVVWNLNSPADYARAHRRQILLATTNPAKSAHLDWLLAGVPLRRVTLAEAGLRLQTPPPETERTLAAIARSKAVAWSRAFGGLALASDGGVAIPALGDSWEERLTARFTGPDATDRQRVEALLALLRPYRGAERSVVFHECVALADNGTLLQTWAAASAPGLLAESYQPEQLVSGFWLLTLWRDPVSGKRFSALAPDDSAYADGAWARIKPGVQAYVREYCERRLSPAT